MPEPATKPSPVPDEPPDQPPVDPYAVDAAYHFHRARRRARNEHSRSTKRARLRFWAVLAALVFGIVFLALTVWHEAQSLFGI